MKKREMYLMTAGLSLVLAAAAISAAAQTVDNNFGRGYSVGVNDRAKTEYSPLNIHAGSFWVEPGIGLGYGSNDNIYYTNANKKSSGFFQITPQIEAMSDWGRHSLSFGLSSNITQYGSASSENTTTWDAHANGRIDITSRANVFGNLSHRRQYETRDSVIADASASKPVPIDYDSAGAGITLIGNRLRFIGNVSLDKEEYSNVTNNLGGLINESYRNQTTTTFGARVDYAISPNVSFFASAESNKRDYKVNKAANSDGSILSVGTSFDLTKLLRGEIQVGSLEQDYKTQGKQTNTYVNGNVEWFPTELTTVTGKVSRSYYDTPATAGLSALNSTASLSVDHELLRNLILSASVSDSKYDFTGLDRVDTQTAYNLSARYFMSRRVSINAQFGHSKLESKGANAGRVYTDNNLLVAIALKY